MADIKKPTKEVSGSQSRISTTLTNMINEQIGFEMFSAWLYLAMAQWLEYNGYLKSASKFKTYFEEEQTHMKKFYSYLQDRDVMPSTGPIKAPENTYSDLVDIIEQSYSHEIMITTRLQAIAEAAYEEGDCVTHAFMDWFLLEQIEEEAKFKSLLDVWKVLSKGGANGLAYLEFDSLVGES
jgi:ferritin